MINLDKNKIQMRYITGINKCLQGYPTPLDVLYESCMESGDGFLFSGAKMENRYSIDEQRIDWIIDNLVNQGYIEKNNNKYKIKNTPWD
jgi:hypothetical protein